MMVSVKRYENYSIQSTIFNIFQKTYHGLENGVPADMGALKLILLKDWKPFVEHQTINHKARKVNSSTAKT